MMRMRKLVWLLIFTVLGSFVQAQSYTLSGRIEDPETRASVQGATITLKSISDSNYTETTYSDTSGHFQFDQLASDSFRITISSVGFETLVRGVRVDSADRNLGNIDLPRSSQELQGVTVTSVTPPAQQKGDTVQFNASQFKVNPDASAEDLARKIPGITVENGQVQAQGENVRRVTIDGRELFGDDATAALRNLPAEIIDKIQVFDRLSDQAQLTGVDDGNTAKEINIITKANMRNGQFGRVYAGYGTDERYSAGGNTTILKENRRISLVGNFNNTNQQNFSEQDLLGVTSSGQRGGGGGRGGGGRPGGGNFGNFGSSRNFMVGQQNGINRTNAFGINYSDKWSERTTVTGSYFFNNSNNTTNQFSTREYFSESFPNRKEQNTSEGNNYNHRINMRIEHRIDSANQLIITPNLSFQKNMTDRNRTTNTFLDSGSPVNDVINQTDNNRSGNNLNNNILFRHSFPKRGRSFSINLNTSYNQRIGDNYQNTFRRRYFNGSYDDSLQQQYTDQANNGWQVSTNLVYTEPLSEKSQLQFNYNPSISKSKADQQTFMYDEDIKEYSRFDTSLSNKFENKTNAHNAGVTFRRGDRDNSFSFGVNYQHNTIRSDQDFPLDFGIKQSFNNFLPNAMLRLKLSPKSNIRFNYRANTNNPSVNQLQPVADLDNAPYISIGNPNLEQQYMHILSSRYTFTNTQKGVLLMANVFMQKANNYITNATSFVKADTTIFNGQRLAGGSELTQPINLDGFTSLRSFLTFAVPLKFIKTNLNLNGGVTYNKYPGLVNKLENETRNLIFNTGIVLASNVSEFVDFNISYSANFNKVENDLSPDQDDQYFQHVAGLQLNLLSKKGWFFQNDLNNRMYNGLGEEFDQNYFLWNMSIGKKFLKDRKGELKMSVFDLLKQNRSIERNITETYLEDVSNQVLRQYFMLTFTYNLRNFGTAATRAANQAERNR